MGVFDEFRRAWREAVANFWAELEADGGGAAGVYREVGRARSQLEELDGAIAAARQRLDGERSQVEACVRRERMAREIGDEETARIAAEYRSRHQERADVLARKLEVLEAERGLFARDLKEMETALRQGPMTDRARARQELEDLNRHPREEDFRTLEEVDRGRTAEERLEELKRRMGH